MFHFSIPVNGFEPGPAEHPTEDDELHGGHHNPQSMSGSDEPLAPIPRDPWDNSTNNTKGH